MENEAGQEDDRRQFDCTENRRYAIAQTRNPDRKAKNRDDRSKAGDQQSVRKQAVQKPAIDQEGRGYTNESRMAAKLMEMALRK